ncbi:MAG TPA: ATP-binding cassette domain-containing protein [Acidobacteriota bacterium]|nr:ATP-binding cassette domain-containing protein [Acidobacteriota bacterium]
MLAAKDVGFAYPGGRQVFAQLEFSVAAGSVAALVGRNGSGKSTLLRLCNGLLKPTTGSIWIGGADARFLPASKLAHVVGTVFQSPEQQIFKSRVSDEVSFGPRQLGLGARQIEQRVEEALFRAGLQKLASAHPLDLNRTLQRFVALASALAMKPRLLLLDEPQQGMDKTALKRLEIILHEEKAAGVAVVVVCHDMEFVSRNADEVLVLSDGHLVAHGSPIEVFSASVVLEKAGLVAPENLQLSSRLGLSLALSAEQLVAEWLRHLSAH